MTTLFLLMYLKGSVWLPFYSKPMTEEICLVKLEQMQKRSKNQFKCQPNKP